MKPNWQQLEKDFIKTPKATLGAFADANNLSLAVLERYANRNKWHEKRSQYWEIEASKAVNLSTDNLDKSCIKISNAFINQVALFINIANQSKKNIDSKELMNLSKVVETAQKVAKLAIGESADDFVNRALRYGYVITPLNRSESSETGDGSAEVCKSRKEQLSLEFDTILATATTAESTIIPTAQRNITIPISANSE